MENESYRKVMNSRERMIAVLEHKTPDKVPHGDNAFDCNFYEQITGKKTLAYGGWAEKEALWSGKRDKVIADYIDALCTLSDVLEWDYIRVPLAPKVQDYTGYKRIADLKFQDGNGKVYNFNPEVGNIVYPERFDTDMTEEDLEDPDVPFTVDDSEMDIARGVIARRGKDKLIIGFLPAGGAFPYQQTVGPEEYMVRMITEPEFVKKACDLYSNRALKYAEAFIKAGCDGIMETEDYADSKGLTMGKPRFDEMIYPYLKKLTDGIHQLGGYFIKHTDGYMMDALESLVEAGVDGWHGIQPSIGMTIKNIREKIGDRLVLFGGVCAETYLVGTREQAMEEVRQAIKYGTKGGIVLTCGNIIEPGANPEVYMTAMEQLKKIGNYPIDYNAL